MNKIQEFDIDRINELPKRKLPENVDLNVSVFRSDWSWRHWRGFWWNIKRFFRAWRPAWHRATKGYCRMDTWDVDRSLTVYLIKVLTEYRNCVDAHPFPEFSSLEEWVAEIDLCIDRLIFTMGEIDTREEYERQCEARKKAFAFLGEYLPHIWW